MIVGLEGVIVKKEPTRVHLMVSGVVYEVYISFNCYGEIGSDRIFLHTTHIIREDAQLLFGFLDRNEKNMFDRLIKISGVGGKVAMAICSTYSPVTFQNIIETQDISSLKRVPGIGPKGAGRILVELGKFAIDEDYGANVQQSQLEAYMALESLGFKKEEVSKALQGLSGSSTGELVKAALSKLQRL